MLLLARVSSSITQVNPVDQVWGVAWLADELCISKHHKLTAVTLR